jgi:hypothetical protein
MRAFISKRANATQDSYVMMPCKEKGERQVKWPYVFDTLNDLLIIPVHNLSWQSPLNHLTKAGISIITFMSTSATNVKINMI